MSILNSLDQLLAESASSSEIPAASIAVSYQGQRFAAACGILNLDTGITATTDSVFQIGSITKLLTATLILQLEEQGLLDLDEPIVTYLPNFRLRDMNAARKITAWHLLTHSSGMVGDVDIDTGRGEDRIKRLVEQCRFLPMLHDVGKYASYCNVGLDIAGHLAERLTGRNWDQLIQERILTPLKMTTAFTLPEDAPRYRVALGHVREKQGMVAAKSAYMNLSSAPSGTTATMSASNLLDFAEAAGLGRSGGERLLSPATIKQMTTAQVEMDEDSSWGLGWMIQEWSGDSVIQHGGTTLGQTSYLLAIPEKDLAIVLLTNSESSQACYKDIVGRLIRELGDVEMPSFDAPTIDPSLKFDDYIGNYKTGAHTINVFAEDGTLKMRVSPDDAELKGSVHHMLFNLAPAAHDKCLLMDEKSGPLAIIRFINQDAADRPTYLRFGARLARKTLLQIASENRHRIG